MMIKQEEDGKYSFTTFLRSLHLLPAGRTGARHEWQKHWSTESRTKVINMTSTLQMLELINRFAFFFCCLTKRAVKGKLGWVGSCARGESEKVDYEENSRKKFFSWFVELFFSPCVERTCTTERDVNASTERTELREKNHRSRLSFRGECRKDLASGCSRGSCEVETL